jgi:hypothetical protein
MGELLTHDVLDKKQETAACDTLFDSRLTSSGRVFRLKKERRIERDNLVHLYS